MTRWTVSEPTALDFDGVVALRIRASAGSVSVLSTEDRPRLEVNGITGQPLVISHEAGILTVTYPNPGIDGLLRWLRPGSHSAEITVAVPKDCPAELGVGNANTFVSGIGARTSIKSLTGSITLDGVTGNVEADTVSGDVEAQGLTGRVGFKSLSGDLTLADGAVERLEARTVSGAETADVALACDSAVRVSTMSGAVVIRVPAGTSAQVNLRSATGRVRSDFPGLKRTSTTPGGDALSGKLGSGSGRLSVTSMSGQVTLLERCKPGPTDEPGPAETEAQIP